MRIKDIAERANVSMITVSRVINTPEKVSPETREKITAILEEVGYVHNTAAHNLARKKSGVICVYYSKDMGLLDPFFQQFLVGVGAKLSEANYSISLVNEIKPTQFCDGYVFSGHNFSDKALENAKKTGKPVALFGSIDDDKIDCIDTDNEKSAKTVVEYLLRNGSKKIAIVLNTVNGNYVHDRFQGYKDALEVNGLSYDDSLVYTVDNSIQGGMEAASRIKNRLGEIDGVFCITDLMAIGFIMGMENSGVKIPEDISVVGFDGLGHHLMSKPRVTTMVQPVYDISRSLAQCLLDRINNPDLPRTKRLLDGKLLEEESVKQK